MKRDRPWETREEEWRARVNRVRAGKRLAPSHWPGGARCAFALSFDCDHETFEMGAGSAAIGRLAWANLADELVRPEFWKYLGNIV